MASASPPIGGSDHGWWRRAARVARVELHEVQPDLVGIGLAQVLEEGRNIPRRRRVVHQAHQVNEGVGVAVGDRLDAFEQLISGASASLRDPFRADLVGVGLTGVERGDERLEQLVGGRHVDGHDGWGAGATGGRHRSVLRMGGQAARRSAVGEAGSSTRSPLSVLPAAIIA